MNFYPNDTHRPNTHDACALLKSEMNSPHEDNFTWKLPDMLPRTETVRFARVIWTVTLFWLVTITNARIFLF